MDNLSKEIEILQHKAALYENLMDRAHDMAKKLLEASRLLDEVAEELDPKANKAREMSGINYDEIADDFYLKMQAGLEICADLIMKTYPEWNYGNAQTLLNNLRKRPNVDSRKEGRKIYYYCRKETR